MSPAGKQIFIPVTLRSVGSALLNAVRRYRLQSLLVAAIFVPWVPSALATDIPSEPQHVISLDGKWRFKIEQRDPVPTRVSIVARQKAVRTPAKLEPFQSRDFHEDKSWHDLRVPSNWEMSGFTPVTYNEPDNVIGAYRLWFDVPADWRGSIVKLNFDGVQNGAEVYLNGQSVAVDEPSWGRTNYHEGGWTAFQADLTPAVEFGKKNLLAVLVTKNTKSANMDTGWFFFLGGIHRSVTLFAVPATHLDDLSVRTHLPGNGKAELRVLLKLAGPTAGVHASIQLEGEAAVDVQPNAQGEIDSTQTVARPRLWSAEHPNRYTLTVDLKDAQGRTTEHVTRRIGLCEVSIKKGIFLVNGVPVKLAGMCRHDVYPTLGTALNEDAWRKDLTLMKAANVNAVRTSHYPYGAGFYDLCDQLGMYVVDEMPACWTPTNTDELSPAFAQRARETVRRDKNHPCVIIWAVGNENKPGKNNRLAAEEIRKLDPTRPRAVSCENGDVAGVELDDAHYPSLGVIRHDLISPRRNTYPIVYLENPNTWDARNGADYGCFYTWGAVLDRNWKLLWNDDHMLGSFTWEWQDRAVLDVVPNKLYEYYPDTGICLTQIKGLCDAFRNPRPGCYEVKVVYAPIKVETKPKFGADSVTLDVWNHYSFTNLSEFTTRWHVMAAGRELGHGAVHPALAPRSRGLIQLEVPRDLLARGESLRVDFDHPDGDNIVTYEYPYAVKPLAVPPHDPAGLEKITFPKWNLTSVKSVPNRFGWHTAVRHHAWLTNISLQRNDHAPAVKLKDEAALDATPLSDVGSVSADVVLPEKHEKVVAHLRVKLVDGRFSYYIEWVGREADIQELGWAFTMPKTCDHFAWHRQAYWSYYPDTNIGRASGVATPDSAHVPVTKMTRPDAFDFNSTKYQCELASLTDAEGTGLVVTFDPGKLHQCRGGFGPDGTYRLIVNKQCSPPRDFCTPVVGDMYLDLHKGDKLSGEFWIGAAVPRTERHAARLPAPDR